METVTESIDVDGTLHTEPLRYGRRYGTLI